MAVSFIGRGNRSNRRKPQACCKVTDKLYHIMLYTSPWSIWLIDFWYFNATFRHISAISWRPVLVLEEASPQGGPWASTDFPKLAEKLSVVRTDRHEDLVRQKNILPVRKKSPKKFTVMCIMFSLAFLECFTIVWFL